MSHEAPATWQDMMSQLDSVHPVGYGRAFSLTNLVQPPHLYARTTLIRERLIYRDRQTPTGGKGRSVNSQALHRKCNAVHP